MEESKEICEVNPAVMGTVVEALKIEEVVTPEILEAILATYNNKHTGRNAQLVDFTAKEGTIAGDNYMSLMYAVKMRLKTNRPFNDAGDDGQNNSDGTTEELPIMLKVLPRNEFRVKIINEGRIFLRDVKFYSDIIPKLENFQHDVGLGPEEICAPWPTCFASRTDGKDDFLAMEDLKVEGYRMASRQEGLDFEHCKVVLETMARYHAISFALFKGDFDKILETYPWLEETMFRPDKIPQVWKDMIQQTYQEQAKIIREKKEELGAELLEKIYTEDYFEELHKQLGGKVKWAVIGHGDCWTNNILFLYDPETKKPVSVKFVDFQVTRVSSRMIDIHYFLHSSPNVVVLNEQERELEQIYFDEFTRFLKKLGIDGPGDHGLTQENFFEEIDEFRYYGVVSGFMLAVVTSAESADVPEMETVTEDQMMSGENVFLKMMKGKAVEKIANLAGKHLPRCRQMKKHLAGIRE